MKRLVLVDGNALFHRAYHATPPLTTSNGELVNAVYGFALMLLKSLEELQPDYIAVTWDMKAPTFRHAQYESYKANRGPADEALSAQYERVFQVVEALNIPEFKLPGFEADDLVAALARQAEKKEKSLDIIILTGDRDMMQLINKRIKVLMPRKTLADVGLYGEEEFAAKYGFAPKNLVDFKGLAGDPSDNIPGVAGVGEATATKLIQEYGTIERIYKHLKELPERTRQLLEAGKENAFMSKKLATLEEEIPIKLDLLACRVSDFNKNKVIKLFEELEFRSLLSRISSDVVGGNTVQTHQSTTDLDHQVEPILQKMSQTGVLIDCDYLNVFGKQLKDKLANIEKEIYSIIGYQVNLNSPKQLSVVLFDELHLPVIRKTKTGRSTDEATLHELANAHPAIPLILEYRQLFKLISTYIDALPKYVAADGRVHSTFNVEGAATGRISSESPNLQNIPIRGQMGGELRRAFVASSGKVLLAADYSQVELRIMAHLSQDSNLTQAFNKGIDIHVTTASKIFQRPVNDITKEQRAIGKTMNFATLYGQGPHALSRQLGVDFNTARQYIAEYFDQFPKVREWMEETLAAGREKGYVETLWGRKRYIPELQSNNRQFQAAGERAATNHPVQGSSADMIKKAMVEIDQELSVISHQTSDKTGLKADSERSERSDSCKLILQVHDELLFECDPNCVKDVARMVREKMENAIKLDVPIVADLKVGPNWGEMERLEI